MVAGADIVSYAKTQLGDPYVWGAEGPDEFDCSGLVQYVYKHFGLTTPRTTAEMQAGKGGLITIQEKDLRPGDLILSKGWNPNKPNQGHVGIYAGGGKLVEAGNPVKVTTFGPQYRAHTTGFRRVPGVDGAAAGSGSTGGTYLPNPFNPTNPINVGGITGWIPTPKNSREALTNIGNAAFGVGESMAQVGQMANLITRAFLPSNILRGAMGFLGLIFILIGIWFLASEARET